MEGSRCGTPAVMKIINRHQLRAESCSSPKGKFTGASQSISEALGRQPQSTDLLERHPFDVESGSTGPRVSSDVII